MWSLNSWKNFLLKPYLSRGSSKIRGRYLELASYLQGLKCAFVTRAIKMQFRTSYRKLIMRFSVMWGFNCQFKAFISELFHSLERKKNIWNNVCKAEWWSILRDLSKAVNKEPIYRTWVVCHEGTAMPVSNIFLLPQLTSHSSAKLIIIRF